SSGTIPPPRTAPEPPTVESPRTRPTTNKSSVVLFDYFTDELASRKKWTPGSLTSGPRYTDPEVRVAIQEGKLTITPRTGVAERSYNGWVTTSAWNMTAAHARVEVSEVTSGQADTIFAVGTDSD